MHNGKDEECQQAQDEQIAYAFLCDEMLRGLTRWLRAAGYDAVDCVQGDSDAAVLAKAKAEARILLTRDRHFSEFAPDAGCLLHLVCKDLPDCVAALNRQLGLDWLYRPFSRCMLCNTPLLAADAGALQQVPEDCLRHCEEFRYCPHCDKTYWDGGHAQRIRETLQRWNRLR